MIKSILFAIAAIAVAGVGTAAAAEPAAPAIVTSNGHYEYEGDMVLTAVGSACAGAGYSLGDVFNVRMTPPNLGTNNSSWHLTIVHRFYAHNLFLATMPKIATPTSPLVTVPVASTMNIGRGFSNNSVGEAIGLFKIVLTPTSAAITTSTTGVYLEGSIRNFEDSATSGSPVGTNGCDVTFRAGLTLRP